MTDILAEILANKRREVERAQRETPLRRLRAMPTFAIRPRNFFGSVSVPRVAAPNLIAEIKAASPSAGVLVEDFDPAAIARQYAAGGAQALSVLTDGKFFRGDLTHIERVKDVVDLPVLRKDFLIDPYQIHESRAYGADAVLLIAEALPRERLIEMAQLALELDLAVLLEVHDRESLLAVAQMPTGDARGAVLLGINNRNLKTQTIDLSNTERLAPLAPAGMPIVSESGVKTRADVQRLRLAGASALLVGETLMRAGDPAATIAQLFG